MDVSGRMFAQCRPARSYEAKTDEDLLRLALDSEELIPEAAVALSSELARRGINSKVRLNAFRDDEEERLAALARDPGRLFFNYRYGMGRTRFGKAEYSYAPETGVERFKTTVFIVLGWLPLIPTGTYLVERRRGPRSEPMTYLEKLPLDWEQVLRIWVVAMTILLVLILAIKVLPRL